MGTVKFNYEGEMLDGKPHGKGIGSWDNGDRYEGDWKYGKEHGRGVYYYADGDRYEGSWKDGNGHGKGVYYFKDGDFKDGKWENGHFQSGIIKLTYEKGYELSFEGTFRGGSYYEGKLYYRNGDRYEGRFSSIYRDSPSEGIMYYANGSRFDGKWSESGDRGTIYYSNGARFTCGNFDRKNPSGIFYTVDGTEQKAVFTDGKFFLNGVWYYIENGNCSIKNCHAKSSIVLGPDEFKEIVCYLSDIGFNIYCWYWGKSSLKPKLKITSKDEAVRQIKKNDGLISICLTLTSINIADDEDIPYDLWKKNEIIQIHNGRGGTKDDMSYATQFFNDKGKVINKSKEFTQEILKFEKWFNDKHIIRK